MDDGKERKYHNQSVAGVEWQPSQQSQVKSKKLMTCQLKEKQGT